MSQLDVANIQKALENAGIEIYRAQRAEIHIAERQRMHIMDSGVRVCVNATTTSVRFTARSQRSDFPNEDSDALFDLVRTQVGTEAQQRGYAEAEVGITEVKDPIDDAKILDVWHEITFARSDLNSEDNLVEEVRWALAIEKYVARSL